MQLKKCKTNQQTRLHTLKQHSKILPPVQISPKESHRKTNTSVHLSQMSSSTRKLFIPKSHKLSNFFNQSTGQQTTRKTLTSAEQNQVSKPRLIDKQDTNICERIEFLKFKVNKDYFDDQNDQKPLRKNISKQLNLNKNIQYQQRYQLNRQNQFSSCTTSGWNSYSIKKGMQSQRQIAKPQRMKSPRTLVHPVAKIMQKSRGYGKIYSARSLEYTFGLQ